MFRIPSYIMVLSFVIITSCKSESSEVISSDDGQIYVQGIDNPVDFSVRTSVNWEGKYKGFMPCDNCGDLKTTLELFPDNTYELQTTSSDGSGLTDVEQGSFIWNENGSRIRFNNDQNTVFEVQKDQILLINSDGSPIVTNTNKSYILEKTT